MTQEEMRNDITYHAAISVAKNMRRDGLITEDDILGSLGDVINGTIPGRENDEEIIVYETVGIAAQDLVTAKAIYDKAVEKGIGTVWG